MRVRVLCLSLAGFCLAAVPAHAAPHFAAGAARGFIAHRAFPARPAGRGPTNRQALNRLSGRGRGGHRARPYGYGAATWDTLLSGSFPAAPDESEAALPPPPYPPPGYYYPAYYAPPPCIRPVLIHLTVPRHVGKLPRIVYGSKPPVCPQ